MRPSKYAPALAVLPLLLGACGGTDTPSSGGSAEATAAGEPWVVVETGSATPSPRPSAGGSPRPALPPVSFLPTSSACAMGWPDTPEAVLIPMVVTPGRGSLEVRWPNRYGNRYRIAAVPQDLVSGAQPQPRWQTVTTGGECTASATVRGLTSGEAYVIWLDAPDTPRRVDGSRSLYSGKTGVVYPG